MPERKIEFKKIELYIEAGLFEDALDALEDENFLLAVQSESEEFYEKALHMIDEIMSQE